MNLPQIFNVHHGIDDASLINFSDGGDLLVLSIRSNGIDRLQEVDVVVPDAEREDVQAHLVNGEVVSLGHLFPEKTPMAMNYNVKWLRVRFIQIVAVSGHEADKL